MDRRAFLKTVAATSALAYSQVSSGAEAASTQSATPLPTRRLGKTGVDVTVLALGGVAGMVTPKTADFDPVELANRAINAGIKYFDTAPSYTDGLSERNYGEVLAKRRDEVFLATKSGQRDYDGAMRDVEASLNRLQTDHVDLLQVHGARRGDDPERWGKPDGVLKAFERLRSEKVTRFIGVTGHDDADVLCRAIAMYDFDTVLVTLNPTLTRRPFIEKVLPLANEKKMGIQAMKIMGGGLGSLAVGNPINNDGVDGHDEAEHQAKPGRLIQYVLGLPITVVIVGSGSFEELQTNVRAVRDGVSLDAEQRKALEVKMG